MPHWERTRCRGVCPRPSLSPPFFFPFFPLCETLPSFYAYIDALRYDPFQTQLDKEEENEAPILKEDQERINEFARLHTTKTELLQQRAQLEVRFPCWLPALSAVVSPSLCLPCPSGTGCCGALWCSQRLASSLLPFLLRPPFPPRPKPQPEQKERDSLNDAEAELMMQDDEDAVQLRIGECFFPVPQDSASSFLTEVRGRPRPDALLRARLPPN